MKTAMAFQQMKRRFFSIIAIAAFMVSGLNADASENSGAVFDDNYFCMHIHSKEGYEKAFSAAPFSRLRTWDSAIGWPLIEPENDKWNWTLLDSYVELARANNQTLILTLGMSPKWAAADPTVPSPYGDCSGSPPRDIRDWEDYLLHVTERNEKVYGGAIRYWEIWNEPDNIVGGYKFYAGSVERLAELGRAAHKIIKNSNPENMVLSPGITQAGAAWLDKYMEAGGRDATDIVAFHFYWDWFSRDIGDFKNAVAPIEALMKKHGLEDRPLWTSETGFGLGYYKTREERAMAMALLLLAPRYYGAETSCIYAWNNSMFTGMYDVEAQKTTSEYDAYMAIHGWIAGAKITDLKRGAGGAGTAVLERNGRKARIVWRSGKGAMKYVVKPDWGETVRRIDGAQIALPPDRTIKLDNEPVLIAQDGY